MEQLNLRLPGRLSYAPENFILHAGVRSVLDQSIAAFSMPGFSLSFISGGRRSGKTHLSIKLSDAANSAGRFGVLYEGGRFAQRLRAGEPLPVTGSETVLLIDDAHLFFQELTPGHSGSFVTFVEGLRLQQAKLVLLSALAPGELNCDEHVTSRLSPGTRYSIGSPAAEDVPLLLSGMARQRGMVLSERDVSYIVRRVGRDVAAIEDSLERIDHLGRTLGRPVSGAVVKLGIRATGK